MNPTKSAHKANEGTTHTPAGTKPSTCRNRNEILDTLISLLPSQFKLLLKKLNVPEGVLSKNSDIERAVDLLTYYEQDGRNLEDLNKAVDEVLSGLAAVRHALRPSLVTHSVLAVMLSATTAATLLLGLSPRSTPSLAKIEIKKNGSLIFLDSIEIYRMGAKDNEHFEIYIKGKNALAWSHNKVYNAIIGVRIDSRNDYECTLIELSGEHTIDLDKGDCKQK